MATKWCELVMRFQKLKEKTGTNKSTSYNVKIEYCLYEGISINMGCYEIGDWPRHLRLGPFVGEAEALEAFEAKIKQAEDIVTNEGKLDLECDDD